MESTSGSEPAAPKRTKDPRYHVWVQQEITTAQNANPRLGWVQLTPEDKPVKASTKKAAVKEAVALANRQAETSAGQGKAEQIDLDGRFMAVNADAVWIGERSVEQQEVENWS